MTKKDFIQKYNLSKDAENDLDTLISERELLIHKIWSDWNKKVNSVKPIRWMNWNGNFFELPD